MSLTFQLIDFRYDNDGDVRLSGATQEGVPVKITVKDFKYSVYVVPKNGSLCESSPVWKRCVNSVDQYLDAEDESEILVKLLWPLCGYTPEKIPCLEVSSCDRSTCKSLARKIKSKIREDEPHLQVCILDEIKPEQQFYTKLDLKPSAYVTISNLDPSQLNNGEFNVACKDLSYTNPQPTPANIKVCVFDLECNADDYGFPDPKKEHDYIEQIGLVIQDVNGITPRKLFMLSRQDPCEPTKEYFYIETTAGENNHPKQERVEMECFDNSERRMILRFLELLKENQVMHLIAHNGLGFDIPFLYHRADRNYLSKKLLHGLSLFDDRYCKFKEREIENNQLGKYKIGEVNPFGTVVHDTIIYFRKAFTMSSYSLNALSDHFLGGRQKLDMPPREMFRLFQVQRKKTGLKGDETIESASQKLEDVAKYCMIDCVLTLDLVSKVKMIHALYGLSSVTVTNLQQYILTGEQRKSYNIICQKATKMGYFINKDALPIPPEGYQGATVLEPSLGFHDQPILGLDFASLYPSIMQAYNLCFSTCEWNKDKPMICASLQDFDEDGLENRWKYQHEVMEYGEKSMKTVSVSFVDEKVRKGVLPSLLDDLLGARKATKKLMKAAETPFEKMIYNQLQLAYKVSCNSIYGFCGVTGTRDPDCKMYPDCCTMFNKPCNCYRGYLANFWIAQTVTLRGRKLIEETSHYVKEYSKEHNMPEPIIVYGDTDSCYVNPRLPSTLDGLNRGLKLGEEMAQYVTKKFKNPIELEFEKIMWPFLQIAKKRYIYVEWEPGPNPKPKRGAKGVESQRRDNSAWLRDVYGQISKVILPILHPPMALSQGINKQEIIQQVKNTLARNLKNLDMNMVPQSQFIISKQLSGKGYKSPQIHSVLAKKIEKRVLEGDMTCDIPLPGDRVNFVVVKNGHEKLVFRGEDPTWQLNHGPPLDKIYYFEKLRDAICRMTDCMVNLDLEFNDCMRKLQGNRSIMEYVLVKKTDKPSTPVQTQVLVCGPKKTNSHQQTLLGGKAKPKRKHKGKQQARATKKQTTLVLK